jgi:serine/threonine-protein kinase HipA
VPPLIELADLLAASHAVETNSETAADLAYLRGRGTSLGGLCPKCTVIDDDGLLSIGKFPSVTDDRPVAKGEVLALNLATASGIFKICSSEF